jgi:hypothetical protein
MVKWIVQDSKIDKPRYPGLSVLGNMGKAYDDMAGWYITRDVNEESFKQMAFEAAELASGSNNAIQGLLMLGMRDKVTRNGNKYGMELSKTEAIAKLVAGVSTLKEEDAWNIIHIQTDKKKLMSDMAKHIHTQLMNQRTKIGEQDWEHTGKKINSFLSMLDPKDFNEQDKYDLMDEIYKLDRYSYTTMKESIIGDYVKHHAGSVTIDRQRIKDIFDHSSDEKTRQWMKDFEEGSL